MQKTIIECVPELLDRAKSLGLDDDAAEDLVARALTWAIDHLEQFNPRFGLENWLIFISDMLMCEILDRKRPDSNDVARVA